MTQRLADRVALITGAAGGIGEASAVRLASEGANIVVTDVADGAGESVTQDLRNRGYSTMYLHLDVASEDGWVRAIESTLKAFGRLDILVNNAAISLGSSLDSISLAEWDTTIAVSQTGVFLGMRAAAPALAESDHASVINISSIMGSSGGTGRTPAYHAAKGAVRTLTKNAAILWAARGIRVNSIHPGFIETQPVLAQSDPAVKERMVAATPMGRRGRPEEVAAGVAYLASDDSSFVTGSELYIDGGFMAR